MGWRAGRRVRIVGGDPRSGNHRVATARKRRRQKARPAACRAPVLRRAKVCGRMNTPRVPSIEASCASEHRGPQKQ